jgi:type VI secretion system secreted protein Hcp
MAVDGYMFFLDYNGKYMTSESSVDLSKNNEELAKGFVTANSSKGLFEVTDYDFDVEQTLNIGSASSGAGAGKITFNPFKITRSVDRSTPQLFNFAAAGTSFQNVGLGLRKSSGGDTAGRFYLVFNFKLVAVKSIDWSHNDETGMTEIVAFEYGGLVIRYAPQNSDGSFGAVIPGGWNRVKNISDLNPDTPISLKN